MDQTKLFGASLVGLLLLLTTLTTIGYANSIAIFTLNSEISPTEDVFVTGFVSTEAFYKPVTLEVYDPEGDLLYSPKVNFNEKGQFSWLFHPPNGKFEKSGPYTIFASHEDVSEMSIIHFMVVEEALDETSSILKMSGVDSQSKSNGMFESFDILKTTQEIPKSDLDVKTSKSDFGETSNNKIEEFLKSNEYVFIIPIIVGVIAGGVVVWMRVTCGNTVDQRSSKL